MSIVHCSLNKMILVTGYNGQLGYDVLKELRKRNIDCIGTTRKELNIIDKDNVLQYIRKTKPEAVIHCAAYTAVDRAEKEKELCYDVNVKGTEYIAQACKEIDAKMIYISTDYVFSGKGDKPFEVDDEKKPLSVYGKTKYEGEIKVQQILNKYFIIRTSWVFGANGNNFVKTMIRLGKEKEQLNVVCDQIGSPTYTPHLAVLLCDMVQTDKYGVYHATNEGFCSWADFAEEIMKFAGLKTVINHVTTEEYGSKTPRPYNSRLSKNSLLKSEFKLLPLWKEALKNYIEENL